MSREYKRTAETFIADSKVLPREHFTSPEIFNKEKEIFLHQNPVCIGHVAEIQMSETIFCMKLMVLA